MPVLVVLSNDVGESGFDFGGFVSTNGYDLRFVENLTDAVGTLTLNDCGVGTVSGGVTTNACVLGDPLFVDAAGGDFHV